MFELYTCFDTCVKAYTHIEFCFIWAESITGINRSNFNQSLQKEILSGCWRWWWCWRWRWLEQLSLYQKLFGMLSPYFIGLESKLPEVRSINVSSMELNDSKFLFWPKRISSFFPWIRMKKVYPWCWNCELHKHVTSGYMCVSNVSTFDPNSQMTHRLPHNSFMLFTVL